MGRSFRESRFRGRRSLGEDVNPSAYIVNLADCMLVLALGAFVALVSANHIQLNVTEFDESQLKEVDPEIIEEQVETGGSYYEEAGLVYRDPATGILYMVEETEDANADEDGADGASSAADDTSEEQ